MHERTMQAIARTLFVVCCAVPTVATMLVIILTWTPWYHRQCLQELELHLATRTGLSVSVDDFQRLTPRSWRLGGVRLSDPETSQPVLSVRQVWWVEEGGTMVIRLEQPELQSNSLEQISHLVHDRFLCRPERTDRPVRLAADDLTIRGKHGSLTLRDVDGWMRPEPTGVAAWIKCVPADEPIESVGNGVQLLVTRDRSNESPSTIWKLDTGSVDVPIALLADHWPQLRRLGDEATYRGNLVLTQSSSSGPSSWSLDVSGSQFNNIDLGRLSEPIPHRVSGQGQLTLDRCQLDPSGIVNIVGTFQGRGGWMSAGLLPRLAEELGWQVDGMIDRDFQYDLIAAHFDLFSSQLKISGVCRQDQDFAWLPSDVVVAVAGRPVVVSSGKVVPATTLAHLVAPMHSVSVPLSGQTTGLLNLLLPPRGPMPGVLIGPPGPMGEPSNSLHGDAPPMIRIGELTTPNSTTVK